MLLEGLDHYRKGRMLDAVRAWEEAYLLEPTNLRAREFLRSALERIHAVMAPGNKAPATRRRRTPGFPRSRRRRLRTPRRRRRCPSPAAVPATPLLRRW